MLAWWSPLVLQKISTLGFENIFGQDRVSVAPDLIAAIDEAAALAEVGGIFGEGLGSGGVLVTGSVITVGEARRIITHRNPRGND